MLCTVLGCCNRNAHIPLYLFHLYQFQKAVKRVFCDESTRESSHHANIIVVGPIPADNTNSGKNTLSRGKGWKLRIYHVEMCLRAILGWPLFVL